MQRNITITVTILIIVSTVILIYCTNKKYNKDLDHAIYKLAEKSYFEGQRDALKGDIRIKLNKDSTYIWTKSPWDNNKTPLYNPTYLDSK